MRFVAPILICLAASVASAQPFVALDQPAIVPREVAVLYPFRAYADPSVPAEETGLRDLSMSEVHVVVERFLRRDGRFVVVDTMARALQVARVPAQEDLVFIAQQSARLGAEHYRAYNLASAVSELASAEATYARTVRALTHPTEVGEVFLTRGLVELELAREDQGNRAAHEAQALEAFRTLVRIDPGRSMDPNVYPPSVIAMWRRAYGAHFADEGQSLRLRSREAAALAEILDLDAIVYAFTMTDRQGTRLFLQFYDGVEGRFDHDASAFVQPRLDQVTSEVERHLSTTVACQELVLPPPLEAPDPEAGTVYLTLGFSSATYLGRPTDRVFYNRGARLSVAFMLRETFGLYISGAQWVAARDPDGELLASVDSTRGTLGLVAGGRVGRVRVYGLVAGDVARIGRVRATDSFWCKVSEGVPFDFDATRSCEESEITNADPQGHFGLSFGLGGDVRVVGPFWIHVLAGATVSIAPFEDRSVWNPVWLDTGLTYRF